MTVKLSTCPECGKKVKAKGMGVHRRWCGKGKTRFAQMADDAHGEPDPHARVVDANLREHTHGSQDNGDSDLIGPGHAVNGECPHCGGELHIVIPA